MLKNGKSAAIYCRTASGAAKDEFEIHDQEGALLAFAERQGYSNPVAYIDNACSGLTLERPAFSRLTADIRGGRIAAVVMRDLSRVGRDYPSVCGWIEWAKSQGVDIVTLRDHPAGLDRFADLQKALMNHVRSQNRTRAAKSKNTAPPSAPAIAG